MRRITPTDYIASSNEIITLKLSENPTTGYMWELSLSPGLYILSDEYIHPNTNGIVGAGGTHEWRIQMIGLGLQTISGIYKRSWEESTGEENTYHVNIMVDI